MVDLNSNQQMKLIAIKIALRFTHAEKLLQNLGKEKIALETLLIMTSLETQQEHLNI